jgi:hypothetical protein
MAQPPRLCVCSENLSICLLRLRTWGDSRP